MRYVPTEMFLNFFLQIKSRSLKTPIEKISAKPIIHTADGKGALKIAPDALYIDTSTLTIDNVCEIILSKIHI